MVAAGLDRCEHCGRALRPDSWVYMELNTNTGTFHEPGTVPAEESQGLFKVGKACAKTLLRRAGRPYWADRRRPRR